MKPSQKHELPPYTGWRCNRCNAKHGGQRIPAECVNCKGQEFRAVKELGMSTDLTIAEYKTLARHEATIESGLKKFMAVGKSLLAIRDARLYRADYGTFEAYCKERWGISVNRGYQFIEAFEVADGISKILDIGDMTESQARALKDVPVEQRAEVLQAAAEESPSGKPTARKIAETAARLHQEPEPEYDERVWPHAAPSALKPIAEHDDTPAAPVADLAPRENTIGEAQVSITVFINDLIHLKPAYFQMAVADHLDREAARIRA